MTPEEAKHANYVNMELNPIHELIADLYEAMMDDDPPVVMTSCNKIIYMLGQIKGDYKKD